MRIELHSFFQSCKKLDHTVTRTIFLIDKSKFCAFFKDYNLMPKDNSLPRHDIFCCAVAQVFSNKTSREVLLH